ncbi:dysferlin-like isoform X3 [Branchiostoma lanceolatum]|uniref:dysferlin-like isoform X3 n=1 Tax=Branchiostoma lanceolatum TaxID=7740 RepID=UPI003456863C
MAPAKTTSIQVQINAAQNLQNTDTFGKSDPYCEIEYKGDKKKTEVKENELNPVWDQTFTFDLGGKALDPSDSLTIGVKDYERVGRNRLLGESVVPLRDVVSAPSHSCELNLTLQDGNKRPTMATISLKISYQPPAQEVAPEAPGAEESAEGGEVGDLTYGEGGTEEPLQEEGGVVSTKGGKPSRGVARRKLPGNLSNKPMDFQIRIRVLEGRRIAGSNISPVCKVTVSNQSKQTRVKKSTDSPFYDELFFFNFHESPAELFGEMIEIQVFNSRKLRSDAFLGSFKLDIGVVHRQPNHAFLRRWVLLSDPNDPTAGAKGYMKMSMIVLGPGEQPPSEKVEGEAEVDSDDIEANLLRPAGVELRPAMFIFRVFRAEDVPQMDTSAMQGIKKVLGVGEVQKELVDPYMEVHFAGRKVNTKTLYNSDHPEWNQELRLGMRFPSMCEVIKLRIKDWDRISADDTVGTGLLNLSMVSWPGEEDGFLPCFGPCFINMYGSVREFRTLPDEFDDLNLGKGEGVAYRGRVMVELRTILGELPDPKQSVVDITPEELMVVEGFQRCRKYRLLGIFMDASMICEMEAPVEFEVSIGNYGNKLDTNIPPSSSTTQPTNAVFDGCKYYFLPWGSTKPVVVVTSFWENISWRLEALNMLHKTTEALEGDLMKINMGLKTRMNRAELTSYCVGMLDRLIARCRKQLPVAQAEKGHRDTELDRHMGKMRRKQLDNIVALAQELREKALEPEEVLAAAMDYCQTLKDISLEPQNSIPDVMIWMITGGSRRAYCRIPAHQVLFSTNPGCSGKYCGQLQTIFLRYPGAKHGKTDIPALLRVKLWLGLQTDQDHFDPGTTEGEVAVFAETYENETKGLLDPWSPSKMLRPHWSDADGELKLKKNTFVPPEGWEWDGDWFINPELSLLYDRDSGHKHFLEDIYENQSRIPGGHWVEATTSWSDVRGDSCPAKEETELPEGWEWEDEWQMDLNRAVDEEGWEYAVESTLLGWSPGERTYHMCRRRRWVRKRTFVEDQKVLAKKQKMEQAKTEGWEYAPLFNMRFHVKKRKMDMVRRRRWHRKMTAQDNSATAIFAIESTRLSPGDDDSDDDEPKAIAAPRVFLSYDKPHKYQLRCYIYQARDLIAADKDSSSDPFASVSFLTQSQQTEVVKNKLSPVWDQTLLFDEIEIYGDPTNMERAPPHVVVELFDHDSFGSPEFLGRAVATPMVKLSSSDSRSPRLAWFPVMNGTKQFGELLATFELFLTTDEMHGKAAVSLQGDDDDLPFLPPKRGEVYSVPPDIRPLMHRTAIEAVCWGVRNMKKYQLSSVNSPSVQLEIGGNIQETKVIKSLKKNPNFEEPHLFFDVYLPKEDLYMPPVNIKVFDNRQFGRKPLVGVHMVRSLRDFMAETAGQLADATEPAVLPATMDNISLEIDGPSDQTIPHEKGGSGTEGMDWWSKFYASLGGEYADKCGDYLQTGLDTIQVYPYELEKAEPYGGFRDFCSTFPLARGKTDDKDEEAEEVVGEVKATFRIYQLPPDPKADLPPRMLGNLPGTGAEECLIRVYIVRGMDLQPQDQNGLSDPYIKIKLGKKKISDRDNYIPKTLDPVFGRMYEMTATIPVEKDLTITVLDMDLISSDDLIGQTMIDLENRLLSHHRPACGLPKTYCITGPNKWRDQQDPKTILENHARRRNLRGPEYEGTNRLRLGNRVFSLEQFEENSILHGDLGPADQRLALHVLHTQNLVPEHVETRFLYNPLQPEIPQGRLQMWVDIFPKSLGPPNPAFDLTPRQPKKYELRVIVWNTSDVTLDETSITGEQMSDIYVKGWMAGMEGKKQSTDVHYRSLDGEGNFNWRYIFPFEYLPAEQAVHISEKEHFWSLDETVTQVPPRLTVQVWDNDKFSFDDFLGTLTLDLHKMPVPTKTSGKCSVKQLQGGKTVNLFEQKKCRGWWPAYLIDNDTQEMTLTGKMEMTVEVLPGEEVDARPAGKGRDEPNMNPKLDDPQRPETSFLWFTSPFKTFRYIVWKNYKWYFIIFLILLIIVILAVIFIYSFPSFAAKRLVGA